MHSSASNLENVPKNLILLMEAFHLLGQSHDLATKQKVFIYKNRYTYQRSYTNIGTQTKIETRSFDKITPKASLYEWMYFVNSKFLTTGYEIISKLRNKEMMPDIKEITL